jgi:hypothetical protein
LKRDLDFVNSGISRHYSDNPYGFSLRCLKDQGSSGIDSKIETPVSIELIQNYPNPFNSSTVINYNLPLDCHVKLTIYNIIGEIVETLVDSQRSSGVHSVTWAAGDIANGLYFYQLHADDVQIVKKLVIQK